MINETLELFKDMTPWEIVKEFASCALMFALMGALVFLSTLI